jgi:hypothetical protein
MTPQNIIDQARYLTRTANGDGMADDADALRTLADYYRRMTSKLVSLDEDKFGVKSTTDLNTVANQESYQLPSDCLKTKRIEITYDGSNWYKVTVEDSGEQPDLALTTDRINNYYVQNDPKADIFGDYIYLRPIPTAAVTGGLRLWYIKQPSDLSTLSSTVSIPSIFHGYLAYGVASEIAARKLDMVASAAFMQKYEDGLKKMEVEYPPLNLDYRMGFFPSNVRYT